MKKLYILSFLIVPLFAFAQEPEIYFKHFTGDQGLSNVGIEQIIKDRNGFIWVATSGGLHKYDGYEFEVFRHNEVDPKSISNNNVLSLIEDPDGYIWIGTRGGLNRYDPYLEKFELITEGLEQSDFFSNKSIRCLFIDSKGDLWVGASGEGLLHFDRSSEKFVSHFTMNDGLASNHIKSIQEDKRGNFWMGTDAGLVYYDRTLSEFQQPSGLQDQANNFIKSIILRNENELWVGSDGGLSLVEILGPGEFNVEKYSDVENGVNPYVKSMDMADNGTLWIATDGGLNRLDTRNRSVRKIQSGTMPNRSIISNFCRSVMVSDGEIWVGTAEGISFHNAHLFPFSGDAKVQLAKNFSVNAIDEDHDGNFWIGTDKGVFRFSKSEAEYQDLSTIFPVGDLKNSFITSIEKSQPDILWIGTNSGLIRLNTRTGYSKTYFSDPTLEGALRSDAILSLLYDSNEQLWIGTWNGLFRYVPGSDSYESIFPKEIFERVQSLFQSKDGAIWAGCRNGLFRWENDDLKAFKHSSGRENSLGYDNVNIITEMPAGIIWAGTNGGGISKLDFDRNSFEHVTIGNGMPSDHIMGLQPANESEIWITTDKGLVNMNIRTDQLMYFDKVELNISDAFNFGCQYKDDSGNLFFGSIDGIASIAGDIIKNEPTNPKVILEDLLFANKKIDVSSTFLDKSLSLKDNLTFSPDVKVFTIEFTSPNFLRSEKIRYAYKLEGFDDEWNYTDHSKRFATYTNLSPDKYTFRVKASRSLNTWETEETNLHIKVLPPFYLTWWFISSAILFSVLTIVGFIRLRVQSLNASKVLLKNEVEARTQDLIREKESLQAANAKIKNQNQEITLRNDELNAAIEQLKSTQSQLVEAEKMASIGILTAGLAHELNNPLNIIGGVVDPIKTDLEEFARNIKSGQEDGANENLEEISSLLDHVSEAASKATQIIKNLLNITPRGEDAENRVFNALEILLSTATLIRKANKQISFDIKVGFGEVANVCGHPVELSQVFINIIKNSIDAVEDRKDPAIAISKEIKDDMLHLIFGDNGTGMTEEVIKQIYEPFYTTKGPSKGTGLGMYISQSIIKKHNGEIIINSKPGMGTTIKIVLPIAGGI